MAAGHSFLDPGVTSMVLDRLRHVTRSFKDERLARLSPSEERILSLMTQGKTNKEIAAEQYLSEKTVKNYVSGILAKLEVSRRAEASAYYSRHVSA